VVPEAAVVYAYCPQRLGAFYEDVAEIIGSDGSDAVRAAIERADA
jgi:hypothetical protein